MAVQKITTLTLLMVQLLSWAYCRSEFHVCGHLPSGRRAMASAFDGEESIFLMGGLSNEAFLDEIVIFNTTSQQSEVVGYFPVPIAHGTATTDSYGNVYYIGGALTESGQEVSSIYKMSAQNLKPILVNTLHQGLRSSAVASVGNDIYIFGGYNSYETNGTSFVIKFDTVANTLRSVARFDSVTPFKGGIAIYAEEEGIIYVFRSDLPYSYKFSPFSHSLQWMYWSEPPSNIVCAAVIDHSSVIQHHNLGVNYFKRFFHSNETYEPLHVEGPLEFMYESSLVYVPHSETLYLAGGGAGTSEPMSAIYCMGPQATSQ